MYYWQASNFVEDMYLVTGTCRYHKTTIVVWDEIHYYRDIHSTNYYKQSTNLMTSSYKLNIFRVEHVENYNQYLHHWFSVHLYFWHWLLTLCPVFGVLWRIDCISAINGKLYKQIFKWQRIGSSYWIIANDPKLGYNIVKRTRLESLPEKWRNFVLYSFFLFGRYHLWTYFQKLNKY